MSSFAADDVALQPRDGDGSQDVARTPARPSAAGELPRRPAPRGPRPGAVVARRIGREAVGVAGAILAVALTVVAAKAVAPQAPGAQLSPVFVIPVVVAAAYLRPAAALTAPLAAAAAYDFFFTTPLHTLSVDNAADRVTLAVLFGVAGLVGVVAAQARRALQAARTAAERADALHGLAAAALRGVDDPTLLETAAETLHRLSHRTAVFVDVETGSVRVAAQSGAVQLSFDDMEAAGWVARERKHHPAGGYPFFGSSFDFWPTTREGRVVGVRLWDPSGRASLPEKELDLVLGYVALADG